LLRVDDGVSLWAGKFDEKFTDIFSLQDSISQQVARSLSLNLTNEEKQLLTELHTQNTEAYQEYLKGRYFWNKRTGEGLKKSLQHFNRAIDLDPTYALAYAGLADTYVLLANYGEPSMECFQKAKAAALMAIKVDQTLANPYTTLALISYRFERNWLKAESEFKRGIELSPNNATAHHWYGEYLGLAGRHAEAITELKRAQQLDPLSPIINTDLGAAFHKARQYDLAIEQLQKTVKMEPDFSLAHLFLGMCYKQKGMYEEAITELKEGVRLSGGRTIMTAVLGNIYGTAGKKGEALTTLGELAAISKRRHVPGFEMALVYIGLDEKDKAFQWLEKSYNEHDTLLAYLKVDPNLDPLRGDPRFTELLRRIGLTL